MFIALAKSEELPMPRELEAAQTYDHSAQARNCSIVKAERIRNYQHRYGSIEGGAESVSRLVEKGLLQVDREAAPDR